MGQKEISKLLKQAMKAHGVFEKNELDGVYDEQWTAWYADYVDEHGLNALLVQQVTVEELSRFFGESYERYDQKYESTWRIFRPKWQNFTAEDLVTVYGEA